jgi:hypothetical protein
MNFASPCAWLFVGITLAAGCASDELPTRGDPAEQLAIPAGETEEPAESEETLGQREMSFVVMLYGHELPLGGSFWRVREDDEFSDVQVHRLSQPDSSGLRQAVVSFRARRPKAGIAAKVEITFKEQIVQIKGGGEITAYPDIRVKVLATEPIGSELSSP